MLFSGSVVLMLVLAVLLLRAQRARRRALTETPAQRAKRIRDRNETAAVLSIVEDHERG